MIGKPKWFTYRIFGWGIRPRTWQGWVYVLIAIALVGLTMILPLPQTMKMWLFGIVIGLFVLDVLHIMTLLHKVHDERQNLQQLIIERNCSFVAITTLVVVALFQTYQNRAMLNQLPFDISLVIVLGAMLLTKIFSTIYVNKKV